MIFYSPYQFIDTQKVSDKTVLFKDIKAGDTHIRHDRWQKNTLSGRIICQLDTVSPIMIGGEHKNTDPKKSTFIDNYRVPQNESGELAIPGNSLRGMIGSVAETISNSSLRVLTDSKYSVRKNWRSPRENLKSTVFDYFKRNTGDNPDILPWGSEGRDSLTPAEALFGVVESNKNTDSKNSKNLASRVCFYDASSSTDDIRLLAETTLKILGPPKPPSPIMYFHKKAGGSVNKASLNDNGIQPNGRKRYLHHHHDDICNKVWESKYPKEFSNQKVTCTPIDKDQKFHFRIDFDNLSEDELDLLLMAIDPNLNDKCAGQGGRFMHKIGLGKPLGLGSIKIQVAGVFLINRENRYTTTAITQTSRYDSVRQAEGFEWPEGLSQCYSVERRAIDKVEDKKTLIKANIASSSLIDESTLKTLFKLGCRESLKDKCHVCYPFSSQDRQKPNDEGEGFKWFANRNNNQSLGFAESDKDVPTLESGNVPGNSGTQKHHKKKDNKQNRKKDNLYLSNIPCFKNQKEQIQWEDAIRTKLENYGCVQRIKLLKPIAGRTSTIGFVTLDDYTTPGASEKAIANKQITVNGRPIFLNKPR